MVEISRSKYMVNAGWTDVPHITEKAQKDLYDSTPPYLREARSKGIPSLGSGAIYPIPLEEVSVQPFAIPTYWKRGYGLDVGWNATAAIWIAQDPDSMVRYAYAEYRQGQALPAVHATAIKARGPWIRGAIDPASRGRSQDEGKQLIATYSALGLQVIPGMNAVEAGLFEVWTALSVGRLKLFTTLQSLQGEYRLYRRDENGKVVKQNDHCLHGDTEVITRKGRVKILDMVGTTGEVLSVGGKWQAYEHCRMTAKDQETVVVWFEDGSSVRCTPDHRFLTEDGWVDAVALKGMAVYDAVTESIRVEQWKSQQSRRHAKNIAVSAITFAGSIISAMATAFTAVSGQTRMAPSLMGSTFTTRITTGRTTTSAISNSYLSQITYPSIKRGTVGRFQGLLWSRQPSGTNQMRGLSGIARTTKKRRSTCTSALSEHASSASRSSTASPVLQASSAPTHVGQRIGERLASMMSSVTARFAATSSKQTVIPGERPVARHAALRCVKIEVASRADVYCLEVPDNHAFAVGNGTIVHNCLDAMRYAFMTFDRIATVKLQAPADQTNVYRMGDQKAGY